MVTADAGMVRRLQDQVACWNQVTSASNCVSKWKLHPLLHSILSYTVLFGIKALHRGFDCWKESPGSPVELPTVCGTWKVVILITHQ
jgi:hypothetical protein